MLDANVQTAPVDRLAGLNPICGSYPGSLKETPHPYLCPRAHPSGSAIEEKMNRAEPNPKGRARLVK